MDNDLSSAHKQVKYNPEVLAAFFKIVQKVLLAFHAAGGLGFAAPQVTPAIAAPSNVCCSCGDRTEGTRAGQRGESYYSKSRTVI